MAVVADGEANLQELLIEWKGSKLSEDGGNVGGT